MQELTYISEKTKISDLIRVNPDAITAIASINKHFEKLKNPILRKILASRVTIGDAAKIGGSNIDVFFKVLAPLGFKAYNDSATSEPTKPMVAKPVFMENLSQDTITVLDVRADLEQKQDPFQKIMRVIAEMPMGNTLLLINTFVPVPLIHILEKKGYESYVENQEPGLIYTYLKKISTAVSPLPIAIESNKISLQEKLQEFNTQITTIDVRDLEMPLPMVTILQELENLAPGYGLYVHHKKTPQYLLPVLKDRGFNCLLETVDNQNTKLLIYK